MVGIKEDEHVVRANSHDHEEGEEIQNGHVVDAYDVLVDPEGDGDGSGHADHAEERDQKGVGVEEHEDEDGEEGHGGPSYVIVEAL